MSSFKVAIVVLDAPEVPAWVVEKLKARNINFTVRDCHSAEEFLATAADADLVWAFGGNKFVSAASVAPLLPQLPRCGAIVRSGSGTDNIPVALATEMGIVVANTPEAISENVADHAIGLLFAVTRQISLHDRLVREGIWDRTRGWPKWHFTGQTLGLVGFGNIGQMVARKMRGFEMNILASDPVVSEDVIRSRGAHPASLEDLFRQADYVSLHCPLIPDTRHIVNEARLRMMKKSAVLINTGRGGLVDEKALLQALTEGWIAAAGLDVLESEPARADHPFLKLTNVVITPHIGGYSDTFLEMMWKHSIQNVMDLAEGRWPRWVVNREVKPRWALKK